ncbi:hypothetical protein [Mesorhizobium sp. WSM3626]|uniref:hypothetical protein n=1 Tax=Mesorhizobium TaxID=68287 RepID=UPI000A01AD1C
MSTQNTNGSKLDQGLVSESQARRDFLKKAGRFAAVTPPAVTLLLGTSLNSKAIAKSGGSRPGNGGGDKNHPHAGPPGHPQGGPPGQVHTQFLFERGHSDNAGGGSHGGSRAGDPN